MSRVRRLTVVFVGALALTQVVDAQSLADLAYLAAKNQQLQAQIDGLSASKGSHSTTDQSRAQPAFATPTTTVVAPQQSLVMPRGVVMAPSVPPPPPAPPPPSQRHDGAQSR
jgi:hypothetical protein